jgi:telomerase reverse transcriptase
MLYCTPEADGNHGILQIVDFIIWLLFSREVLPSARPHHLLCDGFRKHTGPRHRPCSIQGLYELFPNERVALLKQPPWPQLLSLFGKAGEGIMISMLLDCALFIPIEVGQRNYYQLSGQAHLL